jgi:transposase
MTANDLGLMLDLKSPWKILDVNLDHATHKIVIQVGCEGTLWIEDGQTLHIHGYDEREWRHLDFWQYETVLKARVPRLKDPVSGKTQSVTVPWAGPGSRWTRAFENHAIQALQIAHTVSDAAKLLRVNWHSAQRIMALAVERGMARRQEDQMETLGADEKSFLRGQNYISVLTDLAGRRVLEVKPGATKEVVKSLIEESLSPQQRKAVKAVAMDRSGTFKAAVSETLPAAKIVFDNYHLAADLNKAVDATRRSENKQLSSQGNDLLKGTRFQWLSDPATLPPTVLSSFEILAQKQLQTSRAWGLKELFKGLYEQKDAEAGARYFDQWVQKAKRSRLPAMKKLAASFQASREGILNWFDYQITNALTEGLNSVIQGLKTAARGFRNAASYRIRILFFTGKLELQAR